MAGQVNSAATGAVGAAAQAARAQARADLVALLHRVFDAATEAEAQAARLAAVPNPDAQGGPVGGWQDWADDQRWLEHVPIFDGAVFKDQVDEDPKAAAEDLVRIDAGFKSLRRDDRNWPALLELLETRDSIEERLLDETGPPIEKGEYDVSTAARWIRQVVLAFPGVVYDPIHAATLLGIDRVAFLSGRVQEFFSAARYVGLFNPREGRWWKERLIASATELMMRYGLSGSINRKFVEAFRAYSAIDLPPSRCVHCGESPADWVCHILQEPVFVEHSLLYHPDQRPAVMDEARVSFRAIVESNQVDDDLFDPDTRELVEQVRRRDQEAQRSRSRNLARSDLDRRTLQESSRAAATIC